MWGHGGPWHAQWNGVAPPSRGMPWRGVMSRQWHGHLNTAVSHGVRRTSVGWAFMYASQCWQANACVNRWAAATRPHTGTVSESVTCSGTHCGLPVQAAPSSLPLAAAATWGAVGHWQVHNGEGAHQAHHDDASHVAVTTGTVVVTLWVC